MTTWEWPTDDTATDLQGFDTMPSLRFGGGDGEVEEVLPLRQPGEPLNTRRIPTYLLKSYASDAVAERMSYLCARELNIPYQTVRWVRYPERIGHMRRARARNRGNLGSIKPQVVVGFVNGALPVRGVDLDAHTCCVRNGREEQVLPTSNGEDFYRLLALGLFADDMEIGQMLRSPAGLIFGHDLATGWGLSNFLMAFPEELWVILRGLKVVAPAMSPSVQHDLGSLRRQIEGFKINDPAGKQLFDETLYRLAHTERLPQLLADDLRQAPAPTAKRQARPVGQWVKQRQVALKQVLAEIGTISTVKAG